MGVCSLWTSTPKRCGACEQKGTSLSWWGRGGVLTARRVVRRGHYSGPRCARIDGLIRAPDRAAIHAVHALPRLRDAADEHLTDAVRIALTRTHREGCTHVFATRKAFDGVGGEGACDNKYTQCLFRWITRPAGQMRRAPVWGMAASHIIAGVTNHTEGRGCTVE